MADLGTVHILNLNLNYYKQIRNKFVLYSSPSYLCVFWVNQSKQKISSWIILYYYIYIFDISYKRKLVF